MDAKLKCLEMVLWATEGAFIGVSRHEGDMREPLFRNNLLSSIRRLVLGDRQEASFLREGKSGNSFWEVLGIYKGVHSPY